ncbi:hypothetical protein SLEP1_g20583 [Rubroshorea leprosula]|uniref:Uncharacterized protein n=1 Tax=Rubroshorea leprosula TaxID=152421 RepID=A0AAV5JCB4_9ROSI|nr:hypothetical protein SLEP1_g20583 [Rubroshorea leprosula]
MSFGAFRKLLNLLGMALLSHSSITGRPETGLTASPTPSSRLGVSSVDELVDGALGWSSLSSLVRELALLPDATVSDKEIRKTKRISSEIWSDSVHSKNPKIQIVVADVYPILSHQLVIANTPTRTQLVTFVKSIHRLQLTQVVTNTAARAFRAVMVFERARLLPITSAHRHDRPTLMWPGIPARPYIFNLASSPLLVLPISSPLIEDSGNVGIGPKPKQDYA